ncbi:MAG: hypothetical protein GY714_09595 [Desulfobacterales bacterium]|nr:hypothetical protein [Desulfobacterales bacterium]
MKKIKFEIGKIDLKPTFLSIVTLSAVMFLCQSGISQTFTGALPFIQAYTYLVDDILGGPLGQTGAAGILGVGIWQASQSAYPGAIGCAVGSGLLFKIKDVVEGLGVVF